MQVMLHTELERNLPKFVLDKVDKMEIYEYPNECKGKMGFLDFVIRKWFCNPFSEDGKFFFSSTYIPSTYLPTYVYVIYF